MIEVKPIHQTSLICSNSIPSLLVKALVGMELFFKYLILELFISDFVYAGQNFLILKSISSKEI